MKLLSTNAKLSKASPGWRILGLQLAPHTLGGGKSLCPMSTESCRSSCLFHSGMGVVPSVIDARIARTQLWLTEPDRFKAQLAIEIGRAQRAAQRAGERLAVRLNVFSDILWEREFPGIFDAQPRVVFYDYTKIRPSKRTSLPQNYHITWSWSDADSLEMVRTKLKRGSLAVPFFGDVLPARYLGRKVVDGDLSDARWQDPRGTIVGLRVKGRGGSRPTEGEFGVHA